MKNILAIAALSVVALSGCKMTDTLTGAASAANLEVPAINVAGLDAMSCQEIVDTYKQQDQRVATLERTATTAGRFGGGSQAQLAATEARNAYNKSLSAGQNVLKAKRCTQTL